MSIPFHSLIPFAQVRSVAASIEFYGRLGFELRRTFVEDGETEPSWAWVGSGEASLMLGTADNPPVALQQGVLFYLYVDDLAAKHAELAAAGLEPGEITHPFYAPKGEFRVVDPDGYVLMITHT